MDGGVSVAALQGMSYRELQQMAKKHGVKANQKKLELVAALVPFAVAERAALGGVGASAVAAEQIAVAAAPPSKKARKTLVDEVLEERDDEAVASSAGAWEEHSPLRVKPVDESAAAERAGEPPAGRSPRGIPLWPSGAIDFDAFRDSVKKKQREKE